MFVIFLCINSYFRYLNSVVETILIYQKFRKPNLEKPVSKQEVVDFWMDFLVESTNTDVSVVRFPVSICCFMFE